MNNQVELVIESFGARGDGVAQWRGTSVFVPFTAPGDRVIARLGEKKGDSIAASLEKIIAPGPERATPPCRHFGTCGGCAAQHLSEGCAKEWKRDLLVTAMRRAGFDESLVAPLIAIPAGSRRRAAFAFIRRADGTVLGFSERASHRIVDLAECKILTPALTALIAPLRALLAKTIPSGGRGHVHATLTETGIDLLIEAETDPGMETRAALAAFAEAQDLASLSWRRPKEDAEPVARRRTAFVDFGNVKVEPPPGGFLQPSIEGERAIAALVQDAVKNAQKIADLYAGSGSLTFALARGKSVHAVEGDDAALAALRRAADLAGGLNITTEARDLARQPLQGKELSRFQAVVFDPPRAGAAEQSRALAEAGPPIVVAVSCNPATLARDARLLAAGGYNLLRATPIDQFPWAAQLEAVAVFTK